MGRLSSSGSVRQAEAYLRQLEKVLLDLSAGRSKATRALGALVLEYTERLYGSRLILYEKRWPRRPHLRALYWGELCGRPQDPVGVRVRFRRHLAVPGSLTRDMIYLAGVDSSRKAEVLEFDRRALGLSRACRELSGCIQSVRAKLVASGHRGPPEGTEFMRHAPGISAAVARDLRKALGCAWSLSLRVVAHQDELRRLAERYQRNPADPRFRLVFELDSDHPYGRAIWLYYGHRLSDMEDGNGLANLTDRWMRKRGIPAAVRRVLLRHESRRREVMRILEAEAGILTWIKRTAALALAKARRSVLHESLQKEVS